MGSGGGLLGVRKMFWNQIPLIGVEPCGYTRKTELYIFGGNCTFLTGGVLCSVKGISIWKSELKKQKQKQTFLSSVPHL